MHWVPQDKPGYTLYQAQAGNRTYAIQAKNGLGIWRLFIGENQHPLRTIFVGTGLAECQKYADIYEQGRASR